MIGIDRRLFVFGLCGMGLAGTPVGRMNSVYAATKISPDERSVLIVVDVQNCFLPGGSLAVKNRAKPPVTANKRLAEPTRKILGKHYASDAGEIPLDVSG